MKNIIKKLLVYTTTSCILTSSYNVKTSSDDTIEKKQITTTQEDTTNYKIAEILKLQEIFSCNFNIISEVWTNTVRGKGEWNYYRKCPISIPSKRAEDNKCSVS